MTNFATMFSKQASKQGSCVLFGRTILYRAVRHNFLEESQANCALFYVWNQG